MSDTLLSLIPRGKDNGSWSTTIEPGASVTIPKGYHNGEGKVTANKGTLHRKDYQSGSLGNISLNVVQTFGIPENIAKNLSANNFTMRIEKFNWYQGGWSEGTVAKYTVSYNPSSYILSGTFVLNIERTSYYPTITIVSAFWID